MNYLVKSYDELGIDAEISLMDPVGKVKEFQVILHVSPQIIGFFQQIISIQSALKLLLKDELLQNAVPVSARCFLSDAANQQSHISTLSELLDCTMCIVQQPPLDGSKLALWLQLQTHVSRGNDGLPYYEHNSYHHYYTSADCGKKRSISEDSYHQTLELLEEYEVQLVERGCTIKRDCIRTWFCVRDVDVNYQGIVKARRENFIQHGLTKDTHYIASTGIEGSNANPQVKVLMDAYAIRGLDEGQIRFLYAKDNLNPTYEYGVTFERGVYVDFGDRRKVYISGTASINNKGEIMYPGDVVKQVHRTWDNVEALLNEADCTFDDIAQIIVYLRDVADYQCVKEMFDTKFANVPNGILLAPICRAGWLVEMECIAIKPIQQNKYRDL
jgi:enamine deaminase RidA (YjgF/YER057c/UK114 family)